MTSPALSQFRHALLQDTWMSTAVKDRENPNLFLANGVVDAVELETTHGCASYIRKADAIVQSRRAQRANSAINLIQKLAAQACLAFLIPERSFECVVVDRSELPYDETHPVTP